MLGLPSLSILDQKLLELPVRSAGLEWYFFNSSSSSWCFFGGSFVDGVQFLRRAYPGS